MPIDNESAANSLYPELAGAGPAPAAPQTLATAEEKPDPSNPYSGKTYEKSTLDKYYQGAKEPLAELHYSLNLQHAPEDTAKHLADAAARARLNSDELSHFAAVMRRDIDEPPDDKMITERSREFSHYVRSSGREADVRRGSEIFAKNFPQEYALAMDRGTLFSTRMADVLAELAYRERSGRG